MNTEVTWGLPRGARVLVAMSGGVDSSVAAHRLVRAGMDVIGVTMHLVSDKDRPRTGAQATDERECCSLAAAENARRVAAKLGITHYVLNLAELFEQRVIAPARAEYARGRTPNPCILCNRYMKFDILFKRAEALGCTHVSTGHYARIVQDSSGWRLLRGADRTKEQSYFLAFLTERELERIVFPLGEDTKESVRAEAAALGLEVADRPESQDLCFFAAGSAGSIPDWTAGNGGKTGEIVTTDGRIVGRHAGISGYTRGQRKGLPGGMPEPLYVVDIDPETNRVIVGTETECFASRFGVEEVSLVSPERDRPRLGKDVDVQVRYRSEPTPARVTLAGDGTGEVELREPVRSIAPGQAAVWYSDVEVIGAGTISKVVTIKTGVSDG